MPKCKLPKDDVIRAHGGAATGDFFQIYKIYKLAELLFVNLKLLFCLQV